MGTNHGIFIGSVPESGVNGTVTSVSVVTANGFSGSVATATTTPAITLSQSLILSGYVAADVTYNNTASLAAVAGMSVTVVTGGIYAIQVVVQSTSAVKALNMDFAGTVTPANFIGEWQGFIDPASDFPATAQVSAMGTDFSSGSLDSGSASFFFRGTLEVTTGGTFLLRGAQNVADASNTKILRGSSMTLTTLN